MCPSLHPLRAATIAFAILLTAAAGNALAQSGAADVPGLRLPRDVTPLAYAPRLTIDPRDERFAGSIDIRVRVERSTALVWLNARNLTLASARATTAAAPAEFAVATIEQGSDDVVGLRFARPLPVGELTLSIRYSGRIESVSAVGVFRQQDRGAWYAFTQFEPLDARRAFPCFDEPDRKAAWTLTLRVPETLKAFANMPVATQRVAAPGWREVTFETSPPLPSYLLAFAVGDFDVVDAGRAGMKATPISIITPRGRGGEAAYAAANTGEVLAATEKFFGIAYPFRKLDLIAYPLSTFGGAMENPGLITYTARTLLARPDEMSPGFKQRFLGFTAHEIAHMWFGNYVTMAWWDDLWLNESFASWMASTILMELHPKGGASDFRAFQRFRAMNADRLPSARRVRQPVTEQSEVKAAFDGITYAKGESILVMFEAWLGPEKFRAGVRRYMGRHAWGNATAEDFFAALAATDAALVPALRGFVERPGVPVLDVELDCTAEPRLVLAQHRFEPAGAAAKAAEHWVFPACFEYGDASGGHEVCALVKEARQSLPLPAACPQWVIANRSGIGYFLPRLSPALYAALPAARRTLMPKDYVGLLIDVTLLTQSAVLPYSVALPLAATQADNASARVARRSLGLATVPEDWVAVDNASKYATWVRELFAGRARALGWLPHSGDDAETMRLRQSMLPMVTLRGKDAALAGEAQQLARRWLADRQAMPPSVRQVVLQTAIATAGHDAPVLFDALVDVVRTSKDGNERADVYAALGFVVDPALLERALALALDGEYSPRESTRTLREALAHQATRAVALGWLERNIVALSARTPVESQGFWPTWLASACTPDERARMVALFESRVAKLEAGPRSYRESLEKIDLCIAARKIQQAPLNAFLAGVK